MRIRDLTTGLCYAVLALGFSILAGCNDVSSVSNTAPAGPGALAIASLSLPDGVVNQPYATTVGGSGGISPYNWSVSPPLPPNLDLDPAMNN